MLKDQKHEKRKLLSFPGFDKPPRPQGLNNKDRQKVERDWKKQEDAEGYDRTVAYIKGLVEHMDKMEQNRNKLLGKKEEDINGDDEFKKHTNA